MLGGRPARLATSRRGSSGWSDVNANSTAAAFDTTALRSPEEISFNGTGIVCLFRVTGVKRACMPGRDARRRTGGGVAGWTTAAPS